MANNTGEHKQLGWALIGCGGAGRRHATGALETPGVEVVGFCDVREASAISFSEQHPGAYHTSDPERIFNDPDIDIVSIATAHNSHADLAIATLDAGKHLWLEKPMAMTASDCMRIDKALKKSGTKMMINFSIRFSGAARLIKDRIRPKVSHGQCMMAPADLSTWRWHPVEGGGPLYDVGVHAVDFLCWVHDSDPVEVSAVGGQVTHPGEFGSSNLVDTAAATLRFANGSVATFLMSDAGSNDVVSKWFFEFFDGENSAILDEHFSRARFSNGETVNPPPIDRLPFLVEAIRNDSEPYVSASEGIRATRIVEKIAASIQTGLPQNFDDVPKDS